MLSPAGSAAALAGQRALEGACTRIVSAFIFMSGGKSAHQELFEVILVAWKSDINFLCQAFEHFQLHCLSEGTNNHLYLRAAACSCRRGSSIVP